MTERALRRAEVLASVLTGRLTMAAVTGLMGLGAKLIRDDLLLEKASGFTV